MRNNTSMKSGLYDIHSVDYLHCRIGNYSCCNIVAIFCHLSVNIAIIWVHFLAFLIFSHLENIPENLTMLTASVMYLIIQIG